MGTWGAMEGNRPMRLAYPRPNRSVRSRRVRGPLGVLIASMVLLASAIGPVTAAGHAAASPTKTSSLAKGPTREVTKGHIASAKEAGKAAIGNPRSSSVKALPVRKIKIDHPAKPSAAGLLRNQTTKSITPRVVAGPDVQVATQFAGINQSAGGFYPPDPWVAVNSTYVVQITNSIVRVSNRAGTEISSTPEWALFGLPGDQFASDGRIIWDATHGRWVALSASFNSFFDNNYLALAVSDGADPTAGWSTYLIYYADWFPDYPSLASSTDKIVMADDLFDFSEAFYGADINTITWASILGGGVINYHYCDTHTDQAHPRAALVLSPSADVHLITESTVDGGQWYFRVKGAGSCAEIVDATEFTGFAPFTMPPAPRQSPGDTIDVVDERPTDAVWQNNKLWWVSTFPISYDGGSTIGGDGVALWTATTATTGAAVPGTPQAVQPGTGIDAFMGGIGMTRNGTLVTVYSQSSSADFVSMRANQIAPGLSLGTPITLDTGDATYATERWGDYAGVAMDPIGTGSAWVTHEVADADGNWRTQVVRLVADNELPTNPGVPTSKILAPAGLSDTVPVRISWTPATDISGGTVTYLMAESVDDGGFYEVSTLSGTTIVRPQLIGHVYNYVVGAIDAVGNTSSGAFSPRLTPYLYQQTSSTTYSGTWSSSSNANYSGGSVKYASTAGRYATFTATNARSIAFITTKGPSRGSFKVYVDGVLKATVSTYSSTTKYRQIVYQFNWATPGTHKIKIYVKGTSGHPRVDIDAFVVLKPSPL
jgi:hypothetical protein